MFLALWLCVTTPSVSVVTSSSLTLAFPPPSPKDPGDYIEPVQIIRDNLPSQDLLLNHLSKVLSAS